MRYLGATCALVAPLLMTLGFVIWESRWKGSAYCLNTYKCSLASALFVLAAFLVPNSFDGETVNIAFLVLSSFLGIFIGDGAWLYALKHLGPRMVIVVDMIKPFLAAILVRVVKRPTFRMLELH